MLTPSPLGETTIRRIRQARATGVRGWFAWVSEPYVLFPALTVVVLAVIWSATFNLIRVERRDAATTSNAAALQLANTYEAQVVRALREIDQTLKVVKYAYQFKGAAAALADLKARALLPPELLFIVSIVRPDGTVLVSTHVGVAPTVATPEFVRSLHQDAIWIDQPRQERASGEWTLQFGRPLNADDGALVGAVVVTVDASYFVSGYDPSVLGADDVLALLGTDGMFRVRRTGDRVTEGTAISYALAVPGAQQADPTVTLTDNPWDGVRRYTVAHELYEFPLAVVVGLSEHEQLATTRRDARLYLERAAIGSALLVLLTATLGRMSWSLARGHKRETEANLTYALRIEYLAYHDGLTALPNRSLFNKLLSQAISQAQRYRRTLAVAFIDLDRFKQINDTLGHEAGDQLLKEVANRLKSCLRDSDTVARLGGDEFVVLLTDMSDERYAAIVAQKVISSIARPFVLIGQDFRVTASIGISTYPKDGLDEVTLTKNADIAMYQAKGDGKNNFQFYSEKLNANSLERLALESSLRHALEAGQFLVYYQAKRDIATGQITGMEALLRWQHPDLGLVLPRQFLPLAEETGLILPIGQWVLQTACAQNVAWQKQGLPHLCIAVNLTARQFAEEHLLRDLVWVLQTTGMAASLLELELHESVLLARIDRTVKILTDLKTLGVRIAIDDFGTGYSSLATLQRFPLDTIKIDRSYIRDITLSGDDNSLTQAIIEMGRSLSLTVVAQGVETREQAEFLRANACDELQGFYFNKPMSATQFTALLQVKQADVTLGGTPVVDTPPAGTPPAGTPPTGTPPAGAPASATRLAATALALTTAVD
jgi:diguanylate cyclase (GGDEF)-like protein